jgi:hypothetical protein
MTFTYQIGSSKSPDVSSTVVRLALTASQADTLRQSRPSWPAYLISPPGQGQSFPVSQPKLNVLDYRESHSMHQFAMWSPWEPEHGPTSPPVAPGGTLAACGPLARICHERQRLGIEAAHHRNRLPARTRCAQQSAQIIPP